MFGLSRKEHIKLSGVGFIVFSIGPFRVINSIDRVLSPSSPDAYIIKLLKNRRRLRGAQESLPSHRERSGDPASIAKRP